jgi:hypothetical protein
MERERGIVLMLDVRRGFRVHVGLASLICGRLIVTQGGNWCGMGMCAGVDAVLR